MQKKMERSIVCTFTERTPKDMKRKYAIVIMYLVNES